MNFFGISHIGNSRNNQEDNLLINQEHLDIFSVKEISQSSPCVRFKQETESENAIFAVSDGMGGHASGEIASYMAVKYLSDNYSDILKSNRSSLLASLAELNREVTKQSYVSPEYKGMGATLCGVIRREDSLLGFNVGDSRLYRFYEGTLQQVSKDHSEGQRLLDLKLLNEEELKSFPNRKAIYKYIGMRAELVADVFEIAPCNVGTILLLCSDGLTDVVSNEEIRDILNTDVTLREKGEMLLSTSLARNVGHGDNITIVLTEF